MPLEHLSRLRMRKFRCARKRASARRAAGVARSFFREPLLMIFAARTALGMVEWLRVAPVARRELRMTRTEQKRVQRRWWRKKSQNDGRGFWAARRWRRSPEGRRQRGRHSWEEQEIDWGNS